MSIIFATDSMLSLPQFAPTDHAASESLADLLITPSQAPAFLNRVRDGEVWLFGCDIPEYFDANRFNHKPKRPRKLLLHRREIKKFAVDQVGT